MIKLEKMVEDLNVFNAKDLITEKSSVNVVKKSLSQIKTNMLVKKFIKRSSERSILMTL